MYGVIDRGRFSFQVLQVAELPQLSMQLATVAQVDRCLLLPCKPEVKLETHIVHQLAPVMDDK
jgi:hypothetical protein